MNGESKHYAIQKLLCATKCLIDTKNYSYKMKPEGNLNILWQQHEYSDMNYTGYNNNQKRVTVYLLLTNVVFNTWFLEGKKNVTPLIT